MAALVQRIRARAASLPTFDIPFLLLLLLLLGLAVPFFELLLAECQVVPCVVVVGVQSESLLVMFYGLAEQLLLFLCIVECCRLADIPPVVPRHGTNLFVLFALRYNVVQAVCRTGVSFCQVSVGQVEMSSAVVRLTFQDKKIVFFGTVILSGSEEGVSLVHQSVSSSLCSHWSSDRAKAKHEQGDKDEAYHLVNSLNRLKKGFCVS